MHEWYFRNLSNCCKHKYDPDNFTNFLICNFWRVFVIWNYCAAQRCHRWACHVTKMKNSHAQWKGARVLASNVTRAMQHITKLNQRKNMQVRFYNNHSLETRAHGNKTPNMESCFPRYFSRFFFLSLRSWKRNFLVLQNRLFLSLRVEKEMIIIIG